MKVYNSISNLPPLPSPSDASYTPLPTPPAPAAINWEARFHRLADAVRFLSETAVYSPTECCDIPTAEAWDFLERSVDHYSSETIVKPLPFPRSPEP